MSENIKFKFPLAVLTILVSVSMLFSHPQGDDELVSIHIADQLLSSLKTFNLKQFIIILLQNYHPPGREIILMITFLFLDSSLFSARLITVILYILIILKVFELSKKISKNSLLSFFASMMLALTGIFQIQAMVSIHGITTLLLLLLVTRFVDFQNNNLINKKDIFYIITLSIVGFLFSNTFLLFSAPMYLIVNYLMIKSNYDLKFILTLNVIIFLFYLTYFLFFLGIPYYLFINEKINAPVGQLYKYFFRYDNSELSLKSLIENFGITNFYTFPFLFYFLSIIGTINIFKNYKIIFFILIIYFILFNFIILIHTGQHFLTYIIITYPFGFFAINKIIKIDRNKNSSYIGICLLLLIIINWTYFFHIKSYKEQDYPNISQFHFFLDHKWLHNKKYPVDEIELELLKIGKNKTLNLAGVEWNIYFREKNFFYYKDHFFKKYDCKQVKSLFEEKLQAILFKDKRYINCFNDYSDIFLKNFKKSNIRLILKK